MTIFDDIYWGGAFFEDYKKKALREGVTHDAVIFKNAVREGLEPPRGS